MNFQPRFLFSLSFLILAACSDSTSPNQVQATCGDDVCQADENCQSCASDCGCNTDEVCSEQGQCQNSAQNPVVCGNGVCEFSEHCNSCIEDCACDGTRICTEDNVCIDDPNAIVCGDGTCDDSENCASCQQDCRCENGQFCNDQNTCQPLCGNGTCDDSENCASCQQDCGCENDQFCNDQNTCQPLCGNGTCDDSENCNSCAEDCGCEDSQQCNLLGMCSPGLTGYMFIPALEPDEQFEIPLTLDTSSVIEILESYRHFDLEQCRFQGGIPTYHIFSESNQTEEDFDEDETGYLNCYGRLHYRYYKQFEPGQHTLIIRNSHGFQDIEENNYLIEIRLGQSSCGDGILNVGEACDGPTVNGIDLLENYPLEKCVNCEFEPSFEGEKCIDLGQESTYKNIPCEDDNIYCSSLQCNRVSDELRSCETQLCVRANCGDENVEPGEDCDLGDQNGVVDSGCTADCTIEE